MKKKNNPIVEQDGKKFIQFNFVCFLINPEMSSLEVLTYYSTHGKTLYSWSDEKNQFFEIDDAIDFVQDLNQGERGDLHTLYNEIVNVLNMYKNNEQREFSLINQREYPQYVDALVKARPHLTKKKLFRKHFLGEK
jgi:hypothetical protein